MGKKSMSKAPEFKHCDDYIHDASIPKCLRLFLLVNRMPAIDMMLFRECGLKPQLFATYGELRVRIVMASRMGDVGISTNFDKEDGYFTRVPVSALSDFSDKP